MGTVSEATFCRLHAFFPVTLQLSGESDYYLLSTRGKERVRAARTSKSAATFSTTKCSALERRGAASSLWKGKAPGRVGQTHLKQGTLHLGGRALGAGAGRHSWGPGPLPWLELRWTAHRKSPRGSWGRGREASVVRRGGEAAGSGFGALPFSSGEWSRGEGRA